MFATMLLIYMIGTTNLTAGPIIAISAVLVDLASWGTIKNSFEAWATGTTEDQEFWDDEE